MAEQTQQQQVLSPSTHSITTTSVEFIQHINVENAKFLALVVLLCIVSYHGALHFVYGSDSCTWLLSDGRFQGPHVWQPYGCMLHSYDKRDARYCMRYINYWGGQTHILFVGDSRIRQLYEQLVHHISLQEIPTGAKHSDMQFIDNELNLKVEFKWMPVANASMYELFKSYLNRDKPNVLFVGSATWTIKADNASKEALEEYREVLTNVAPIFEQLKPYMKILWILQDPVLQDKLSPERQMITNDQLDLYNKAAMEVLDDSCIIWKSSRLVAQGYNGDSVDGLHVGAIALNYDVQILLNMHCNDHMNFNDGTCCASREPITTLQLATAIVFAVCMVASIVLRCCRMHARKVVANGIIAPQNKAKIKPAVGALAGDCDVYIVVSSLAKFGLIMAYFFLCDRTNFFMKENKYYSTLNFFLPFGYVMALGLFFTEDSKQTIVLHRDQTDEWKGWMQLVILIYHMTGASQVLPIYMQIRVLVTSYLFLTGFGHFSFFWAKGDYGLFRVCKMVFRLNMLVIMLCFVMNRPYQFYYFVPLVTFWFLVIYCTMCMLPQVSATSADGSPWHYLYMVLKIVFLIAIITILFLSEVLFEKIFVTRPFKALFVTSDDSVKEWWFRWQLDRYSVVFGVIFGYAYFLLKRFELLDDKGNGSLFSRGVCWIVCLLSVIGIMSYTTFTFFCKTKPECNEVHPYVAFIPITSYIILRNVAGFMRTRYSTFFAWFGKISLELFISQYHIWLAADTHGVLVLIPSYPVLNVIVTSFVFVCVSHEISKLTVVLSNYAIPGSWKYLVRNAIIFTLVLIPVGFSHGMLG
ncbi:PREDICTED: CAS1 domain-containing protein 1-like isoform X2 [Priapulus caudatus]|uniref:CAS1 domain-containing protein 1-like isoform X2 n=1 Tax=Priapulus caudatus TaxID=37621 RepID=A0ABM1E276_PRICU|nr:PREDICTED: CAS1 domain-containing protein 1-like isoform X2 [Priapulus caudatus]